MTLPTLFNSFGFSLGDILRPACAMAIGWLLAGLLIWTGARIVGLGWVTFGCAFYTAATASVAASIGVFVSLQFFSDMQVGGVSGSALVGLLITWLIMRRLLNTTMGRAMTIWIFDAAAHVIVALLGLAAGGFHMDLAHLLR
jgi:hypothetical protein